MGGVFYVAAYVVCGNYVLVELLEWGLRGGRRGIR
jgi:hypothetical protein